MLIAAVERAALIDSDDGTQVVILKLLTVFRNQYPTGSKGKSQENLMSNTKGKWQSFFSQDILDMLKAADAEQIFSTST